jgi:hypothetical protein
MTGVGVPVGIAALVVLVGGGPLELATGRESFEIALYENR